MASVDEFATGVGLRRHWYTNIPMSDEDCPERTKFLNELAARKGREPFTWREKLGYREPVIRDQR